MPTGRRWSRPRWGIQARTPATYSIASSATSALPRSLKEVQVGPEHFDRIAAGAMRTPWVPRNPRKIDGPSEVCEILAMAA